MHTGSFKLKNPYLKIFLKRIHKMRLSLTNPVWLKGNENSTFISPFPFRALLMATFHFLDEISSTFERCTSFYLLELLLFFVCVCLLDERQWVIDMTVMVFRPLG